MFSFQKVLSIYMMLHDEPFLKGKHSFVRFYTLPLSLSPRWMTKEPLRVLKRVDTELSIIYKLKYLPVSLYFSNSIFIKILNTWTRFQAPHLEIFWLATPIFRWKKHQGPPQELCFALIHVNLKKKNFPLKHLKYLFSLFFRSCLYHMF